MFTAFFGDKTLKFDARVIGMRFYFLPERFGSTQKKKYIYIQGSPSGCVRRKIPGVTRVDEKALASNSVVTACIGGNMAIETAGQEFLLTITYFEQ